jgi:hypothetical protein
MTACSLSGITVFSSGSHGLYISGSGCVSGVLATGNTGSGVFIGTNNYLSVSDVMSNGNTGVGFSYGTSPTTANSSSLDTITSKNNTGGSWTTSGNWNTDALWG